MIYILDKLYRYGNVSIIIQNFKYDIIIQEDGNLKIHYNNNYGNESSNSDDNVTEVNKYDIELDSDEFLKLLEFIYKNDIIKPKKNKIKISSNGNLLINSDFTLYSINKLFRKLMTFLSIYPEYLFEILEFMRKANEKNSTADISTLDLVENYKKHSMPNEIKQYEWYDFDSLSIPMMADIIHDREIKIKTMETAYEAAYHNGIKLSNNPDLDIWSMTLTGFFPIYYSDESLKEAPSNSLNISHEFLGVNGKETISVAADDILKDLEIGLIVPNKNILLIGEPGVGKTALVEELAHKISIGDVPKNFKYKHIIKINISSIVSGCTLVGEVEEKVHQIIDYMMRHPDTILFLDEIQTIIGAGRGKDNNLDIANILKPYIDHGYFKIIGATTPEEYEKYIKPNGAFNRRFEIVKVNEPDYDKLYEIILFTIEKLAKSYNINWNFNLEEQDLIIKTIIDCTNSKHIIYSERRYNPDASLEILGNIFALALYYGHNSIEVNDIVEAIKRAEFLYPSIRESMSISLQKKLNSRSNMPTRQRIIPFRNPNI